VVRAAVAGNSALFRLVADCCLCKPGQRIKHSRKSEDPVRAVRSAMVVSSANATIAAALSRTMSIRPAVCGGRAAGALRRQCLTRDPGRMVTQQIEDGYGTI